MNNNRWIPLRKLGGLLVLLAMLGAWTMAFAQIDSGSFQIFQNGAIVGQIYVPARAAGTTLYAEHWVLYSNYVYPNARNNVKTEIVADPTKNYANETEFFRAVPWGPGFRYVHVTSNDTTTLPSR